jgi:hypothetical protein
MRLSKAEKFLLGSRVDKATKNRAEQLARDRLIVVDRRGIAAFLVLAHRKRGGRARANAQNFHEEGGRRGIGREQG